MNILTAMAVWSMTAMNTLLIGLKFKYAFLIIGIGDVTVSIFVLIYLIIAALYTVSLQFGGYLHRLKMNLGGRSIYGAQALIVYFHLDFWLGTRHV